MTKGDLRIDRDATRGPAVTFSVDGGPVLAFMGDTIATALLASGPRPLRTTGSPAEPRGYFCGMGICWECAVWVAGIGNVRACRQPVEQGMEVSLRPGVRCSRTKHVEEIKDNE